jgi:hypothetical protein
MDPPPQKISCYQIKMSFGLGIAGSNPARSLDLYAYIVCVVSYRYRQIPRASNLLKYVKILFHN